MCLNRNYLLQEKRGYESAVLGRPLSIAACENSRLGGHSAGAGLWPHHFLFLFKLLPPKEAQTLIIGSLRRPRDLGRSGCSEILLTGAVSLLRFWRNVCELFPSISMRIILGCSANSKKVSLQECRCPKAQVQVSFMSFIILQVKHRPLSDRT